MLQKRSLEDVNDVSAKHPRHIEPSDEEFPVLDFPTYHKNKADHDEMLGNGYVFELEACNENEIVTSCSTSYSSGVASATSEDDLKSDVPCCVLLSPEHYDLELPATASMHSGDIYSYLLEHPPQKLVPVGIDFQAELPEWGGRGEMFPSSSLRDASEVLNIGEHSACGNKFIGSCIIPMPESLVSADAVDMVGTGRNNCSCGDIGSIRCVQQHISESRKELRKDLGEEVFAKLGFCDMGEVVAEKWSEDEEDVFREVIFRNAAFRRDFWGELASEFPSRTKKEIVSYYFNVFMLRKRSKQNRVDALDIDSDNDMWEGAHFSAGDVIHTMEDSDDSGDESPEHTDDFGREEIYGNNMWKSNEVSNLETSQGKAHENPDRNEEITSDACPNYVTENGSSDTVHQPPVRVVPDELQKHHVQDVPRPSDSTGITTEVAGGSDHDIKQWNSNLSGLRNSSGRELLAEPCSSKEWDVGYLTCSKDEEFLPTCSVIEEVFGSGVFNYKT